MKWATNEQDEEDFEQEKAIRDWLGQSGAGEFGYQYINSKGNARNTLIKASFSLDQKIGEDGTGTFADLIAGSDGRDLACGVCDDELAPDSREKISGYLFALGFNEGDMEWLIKMLKLSEQINKSHLEKYLIDLEW